MGYSSRANKVVKVWVNGCFDILHRGHVEMFEYAKSLGDHLKVGIDSDWKIRKTKGFDRPINRELDRAALLRALRVVDEVTIFHSAQGLEWCIKDYSPDVLVVGSDWRDKEVVGAPHAGRVEFFDRITGYSTTNIINRLKEIK